ncbi:unnamed protein product [Musa acuminata subsp. burmannicoides]
MNSRLQTGSATPGGSDIYGQLFQVFISSPPLRRTQLLEKAVSEGDVDANTQNISTTKGLLHHFGGSRIATEVAGEGKRGFALFLF